MRKALSTLIASLLLGPLLYAQSGVFASFKSGSPSTGTSIGMKFGPLAALGGLDILTISASFDEESTAYERDWQTDRLYKYREYSESFEGSAQLIMPHIGARLYLKNLPSSLYLLAEAQMTIPSIKGKSKGERTYYSPDGSISDFDGWEEELSKEDQERINDVLDFVSVALGFGAEYHFSDHFSIGGEYGMRIFTTSFKDEGEDEDSYDGTVDWREEWVTEAEVGLGTTYTSFTLNYYFK
ncbi:MAG: hypothetical protein ACETWG_09035 [Candidatus Neomarinimicrobiota bacterium]